MTLGHQVSVVRRYLLGTAAEEESTALEQEYFGRLDTLEAVESAEEALIEDYLENRLDAGDRARFERYYLASPRHRARVETIRRLTVPSRTVAPFRGRGFRALALAAGLVIAVAGSVWVIDRARSTQEPPPMTGGAAPAPAAPRAFAMSISPPSVRNAGDGHVLVVPAGTDVIDLYLEGEAADKPIARGRVVVRKVSGDEVWQGPSDAANLAAGAIAHVQVPASRLRPDDFIVTLFEVDPAGAESERIRYFLRVRVR